MAILIAEPVNENPGTSDWQKNLLKTTMTTGGLLLAGVTKTDTPSMIKGSRLEVNGSFYYVGENSSDEVIDGWDTVANSNFCYIYAVPGGDICTFSSRSLTESPAWNPALGGWFKNNDRAVYLAYKNSAGLCVSAIVMDKENYFSPDDFTPDTAGGTLAYQTPQQKNTYTATLSRGWYWAELISGAGAGNGGNGQPSAPGAGGIASARNTTKFVFYVDTGGKILTITVGGNGFNGGMGGLAVIFTGGGGGSGGGEETAIQGDSLMRRATGHVQPGTGGSGYIIIGGGGTGGVGGGVSNGAANGGASIVIIGTGNPGGIGNNYGPGGDGPFAGEQAAGGGGGGGFGGNRPAGGPGGICSIWKLTP
ncbi:MAG: hypothetical protein LBK08_11685 [Treponema sp.]|jgi:hypothetical protein|nr:hypothetical protein [Treponema sp.]